MTIKRRLAILEEKANPKGPPAIRVYFHDDEGLTVNPRVGPYYQTPAALFAAQGWEYDPDDRVIEVKYK